MREWPTCFAARHRNINVAGGRGGIQMAITPENGDGAAFFEYVADDVDWIVMDTHALAGHYRSKKDFIAGTFAKLDLDSAMVARLFEENPIA
jgi:ketosteroid isomerase-like protein